MLSKKPGPIRTRSKRGVESLSSGLPDSFRTIRHKEYNYRNHRTGRWQPLADVDINLQDFAEVHSFTRILKKLLPDCRPRRNRDAINTLALTDAVVTAPIQKAEIDGDSDLFARVHPAPEDHCKIFSVVINKREAYRIAKDKKQRAYLFQADRNIAQTQVMATSGSISPNEYALALGLPNVTGRDWEWNHLVAHRFVSNNGQVPENLVLATKHCNTLMLMVEDELSEQIKSLPSLNSEAQIIVTAQLDPLRPHLATRIDYRIVMSEINFDLSISFDPLTNTEPSSTTVYAVRALFELAKTSGAPINESIYSPSLADDQQQENLPPQISSP